MLHVYQDIHVIAQLAVLQMGEYGLHEVMFFYLGWQYLFAMGMQMY